MNNGKGIMDNDLPERWEWKKLGEVSTIRPPKKLAKETLGDKDEVSFVPMNCLNVGSRNLTLNETKTLKSVYSGYTYFADNDVLMAKITPCFENSKAVVLSGLENGIGAGTTELHIARPFGSTLAPRYVLLFFKAPMFLQVGKTKMTGTAGQKRVPKVFFSEPPLPLPPLAEQHRIVAKVDELMTLCDTLKARLNNAQTTQVQLADAIVEQAVV